MHKLPSSKVRFSFNGDDTRFVLRLGQLAFAVTD